MNWHSAISIISTIALFLPVILILSFRLYRYNNYLALMVYAAAAFIYNLMTSNLLVVDRAFERGWGLINNLMDAPLMLTFLMLFSTSVSQKKRMKIWIVLFVAFEIVVVSFFGLTIRTITIVMGPALAVVLCFAFYFFIQKVKISIAHNKALGKAILTASITFAYGCFAILYTMHYVMAIDDIPNIFLIYYLVTIVYSILLGVGIVFENKRIRKMEELLHTRKELVRFFSEERPLLGRKTKLATD